MNAILDAFNVSREVKASRLSPERDNYDSTMLCLGSLQVFRDQDLAYLKAGIRAGGEIRRDYSV